MQPVHMIFYNRMLQHWDHFVFLSVPMLQNYFQPQYHFICKWAVEFLIDAYKSSRLLLGWFCLDPEPKRTIWVLRLQKISSDPVSNRAVWDQYNIVLEILSKINFAVTLHFLMLRVEYLPLEEGIFLINYSLLPLISCLFLWSNFWMLVQQCAWFCETCCML